MRFLIVGLGPVGIALGVRLGCDGNDVTFTDLPQQLARLPDGWLSLQTPDESLTLKEAVSTAAPAGLFDYIILAVRLHEIEAACKPLRSLLAHDSAVVTLQPGQGAAARIAELLGAEVPLPGVLDATLQTSTPGVAVQSGASLQLRIGEPGDSSSWRGDVLEAALGSAGVETALSDHIATDLTDALLLELALGCVTARHGCLPGAVAADSTLRADFEALLREAELCARAAGLPPASQAAQQLGSRLDQREPERPTSCQLDTAAGRRPEVISTGRALLGRAQSPCPALDAYLVTIEACTSVDPPRLI